MEIGRLCTAYEVGGDVAEYPGHHRKVLQVVVSLEQRVTLRAPTIRYL